jgi:hypothetical protein
LAAAAVAALAAAVAVAQADMCLEVEILPLDTLHLLLSEAAEPGGLVRQKTQAEARRVSQLFCLLATAFPQLARAAATERRDCLDCHTEAPQTMAAVVAAAVAAQATRLPAAAVQ